MQKTQRISVGLSVPEHEALQQIATKHRVSLAWIGRHAITEFLVRYEASDNNNLLPLGEVQGEES